MTVYTSWIAQTPTDKGLGRHVEHDEASRRFAFQRTDVPHVDRVWAHSTPVLDQGKKSSCTGNAAAQFLNCDLFRPLRVSRDKPWLTEADALSFYSLATRNDGFGPDNFYPPHDEGSSGLGVAKALEDTGWITGYQHAFDFDTVLNALQTTPVLVGSVWTDDMFNPDAQGYVHPGDLSSPAGGHEYLLRGCLISTQTLVFLNSWGQGWGQRGSFLMKFAEFRALLETQGDIVVPVTTKPPVN